jgi:hypothetical protein
LKWEQSYAVYRQLQADTQAGTRIMSLTEWSGTSERRRRQVIDRLTKIKAIMPPPEWPHAPPPPAPRPIGWGSF